MKSRVWLLMIAIISINFSCNEDYPEVGGEFFDDVSFEIVSWDTLTMNMSTVYYDSTVTNVPSRLLVGQIFDDIFGDTEVQPYFKVTPESYESLSDFNDLVYQYATLTLYYDGYSIGDTSTTTGTAIDIEVYTLQDEMELDDDEAYYNFSSLELEKDEFGVSTPIGSTTFSPEPYTEDSVEIILDTAFFETVFELYESDFEEDDFLDLIQGLTIKTLQGTSVIGFTDSLSLNIYYQESSDGDTDDVMISFSIEDTSLAFNQITNDRTGMVLDGIEDAEELTPDVTGDAVYAQGGLGLAIKIELPYIERIIESDDNILLDDVTIELALGNMIPEDEGSLENGIELFKIDHNNDIIYQYEDLSLVWNVEREFDQENVFEIDVTDFVNEKLSITTADNEDALLIRIPSTSYRSGLDQIIVNNQGGEDNDSKIKLNVIKIK